MSQLPNFLIIGAAKAGTTSLWAYLRQHPEVFFPANKEPNFFALEDRSLSLRGPASPKVLHELLYSYCVQDYESYLGLFRSVRGQKAVGEASVRYLYAQEAPERIRASIPDVRLVAILRNPVSRLYSHYSMNRQYGLESLGVLEAIEAERSRREAGWAYDWHYVNVSRYAGQIRRYFMLFGREQVKVLLHDEFLSRPVEVVQEVCGHIGVERAFVPDMSQKEKVTYLPRVFALDRLINHPGRGRNRRDLLCRAVGASVVARLDKWNRTPAPPLAPGLRTELSRLFRDDVQELEELLERRTGWCT
jgi:hypothetical protein